MRIKRVHNWVAPRSEWRRRPPGGPPIINRSTGLATEIEPPVPYVEVESLPERQHFSPKVLQKGIVEGWLEVDTEAGEIRLKTDKGLVVFTVLRNPGRYCLHCGDKLADDDNEIFPGRRAREHVAAEHAGIDSPDAENPSGYSKANYYLAELRDGAGGSGHD